MKIIPLLVSFLLLTNTVSSFAASGLQADPSDAAKKPRKCPSVEAIMAGGIGTGTIFLDGAWYAGRRHMDYDTRQSWTFVMGPIEANDAEDARVKALAGLHSLTFLFGPQCSPIHNWMCMYNTGVQGYPAVTLTPAIALTNAVRTLWVR